MKRQRQLKKEALKRDPPKPKLAPEPSLSYIFRHCFDQIFPEQYFQGKILSKNMVNKHIIQTSVFPGSGTIEIGIVSRRCCLQSDSELHTLTPIVKHIFEKHSHMPDADTAIFFSYPSRLCVVFLDKQRLDNFLFICSSPSRFFFTL